MYAYTYIVAMQQDANLWSGDSIGLSKARLLSSHNQDIALQLPDPFPRERLGAGHETNYIHDVHVCQIAKES